MEIKTTLCQAQDGLCARRLKGLFVLDENMFTEIYGTQEIEAINAQVDIYAPVQTREMIAANPAILRDAEVIFSSWGIPLFDEELVGHLDNLKIIFYGAGTVKHFVTDSLWAKDVRVSSAAVANAVPVAEYTLGQILVNLKRSLYYSHKIRQDRTFTPSVCDVPGGFNSTIGLISLGTIARILCRYLNAFELDIIAYDPYITPDSLRSLDVTMVALDDIFAKSDIVSLHAPLTDETVGMITGEHILRMKSGATFINTARGALVREDEMIDALRKRPDITAVLDVTDPEPPCGDSNLYDLPNVFLTPHIAGAMGGERRRLGRFVVDELRRYLSGRPLKGEVKEELLAIQA